MWTAGHALPLAGTGDSAIPRECVRNSQWQKGCEGRRTRITSAAARRSCQFLALRRVGSGRRPRKTGQRRHQRGCMVGGCPGFRSAAYRHDIQLKMGDMRIVSLWRFGITNARKERASNPSNKPGRAGIEPALSANPNPAPDFQTQAGKEEQQAKGRDRQGC